VFVTFKTEYDDKEKRVVKDLPSFKLRKKVDKIT